MSQDNNLPRGYRPGGGKVYLQMAGLPDPSHPAATAAGKTQAAGIALTPLQGCAPGLGPRPELAQAPARSVHHGSFRLATNGGHFLEQLAIFSIHEHCFLGPNRLFSSDSKCYGINQALRDGMTTCPGMSIGYFFKMPFLFAFSILIRLQVGNSLPWVEIFF